MPAAFKENKSPNVTNVGYSLQEQSSSHEASSSQRSTELSSSIGSAKESFSVTTFSGAVILHNSWFKEIAAHYLETSKGNNDQDAKRKITTVKGLIKKETLTLKKLYSENNPSSIAEAEKILIDQHAMLSTHKDLTSCLFVPVSDARNLLNQKDKTAKKVSIPNEFVTPTRPAVHWFIRGTTEDVAKSLVLHQYEADLLMGAQAAVKRYKARASNTLRFVRDDENQVDLFYSENGEIAGISGKAPRGGAGGTKALFTAQSPTGITCSIGTRLISAPKPNYVIYHGTAVHPQMPTDSQSRAWTETLLEPMGSFSTVGQCTITGVHTTIMPEAFSNYTAVSKTRNIDVGTKGSHTSFDITSDSGLSSRLQLRPRIEAIQCEDGSWIARTGGHTLSTVAKQNGWINNEGAPVFISPDARQAAKREGEQQTVVAEHEPLITAVIHSECYQITVRIIQEFAIIGRLMREECCSYEEAQPHIKNVIDSGQMPLGLGSADETHTPTGRPAGSPRSAHNSVKQAPTSALPPAPLLARLTLLRRQEIYFYKETAQQQCVSLSNLLARMQHFSGDEVVFQLTQNNLARRVANNGKDADLISILSSIEQCIIRQDFDPEKLYDLLTNNLVPGIANRRNVKVRVHFFRLLRREQDLPIKKHAIAPDLCAWIGYNYPEVYSDANRSLRTEILALFNEIKDANKIHLIHHAVLTTIREFANELQTNEQVEHQEAAILAGQLVGLLVSTRQQRATDEMLRGILSNSTISRKFRHLLLEEIKERFPRRYHRYYRKELDFLSRARYTLMNLSSMTRSSVNYGLHRINESGLQQYVNLPEVEAIETPAPMSAEALSTMETLLSRDFLENRQNISNGIATLDIIEGELTEILNEFGTPGKKELTLYCEILSLSVIAVPIKIEEELTEWKMLKRETSSLKKTTWSGNLERNIQDKVDHLNEQIDKEASKVTSDFRYDIEEKIKQRWREAMQKKTRDELKRKYRYSPDICGNEIDELVPLVPTMGQLSEIWYEILDDELKASLRELAINKINQHRLPIVQPDTTTDHRAMAADKCSQLNNLSTRQTNEATKLATQNIADRAMSRERLQEQMTLLAEERAKEHRRRIEDECSSNIPAEMETLLYLCNQHTDTVSEQARQKAVEQASESMRNIEEQMDYTVKQAEQHVNQESARKAEQAVHTFQENANQQVIDIEEKRRTLCADAAEKRRHEYNTNPPHDSHDTAAVAQEWKAPRNTRTRIYTLADISTAEAGSSGTEERSGHGSKSTTFR